MSFSARNHPTIPPRRDEGVSTAKRYCLTKIKSNKFVLSLISTHFLYNVFMSRKSLFLLLFLILVLIASLSLVFRTTIFKGRAATIPSSSTVLENSYLFASPIQAKADGEQLIRVTVFLLDSQGLGVSNQKVSLTYPTNLTLKNTQDITDDYGKTIFDLSSSTPGKHTISAQTNGQTLPQTVTLVFY